MIEVEHLVKRYGSFTALNGISFGAAQGEILGFLGPNGAGKTTTMRILTGYMPPTNGIAKVAGFDVFEQSLEVRRHVGYLPETVPIYPDMTVKGYVKYIAELRGIKHSGSRAEDVLRQVGMFNRRGSLIRNTSKGMRQRIGLAQALVHDPPILILDEPTIGLDPLQVMEVRDLVRDLGQGHTVMFSTHILSEAEQVCDRVIIINQGQIIAEGTPGKLRDHLQHGSSLFLKIGGALDSVEMVRKVLMKVAGVVSIEPFTDGYVVNVSSGIDIRARVSNAIFEAGGIVLELRPQAMSLEDIFIELTAQQMPKTNGSNSDTEAAAIEAGERKSRRA